MNGAPVSNQDEAFNAGNLHAVTVGFGGRVKHFQSSLGLRWEFGASDGVVVQELPTGQPITTNFSVRNLGMIYSVAYLF